ncbi:MAG: transposase [Sedimentisphaerales bacterium]|nr:transposase [Sedimentisphaerales bacterium]
MLTWTTYGTWLQGDQRGWVKDGALRDADLGLKIVNATNLKGSPVRLNTVQQEKVYRAILKHSAEKGHVILAMAVANNHVHLLIKGCDEEPGRLVARYKNNARKGLGEEFGTGPVWTKGFNKRFCNNSRQLKGMVDYIDGHRCLTSWVFIRSAVASGYRDIKPPDRSGG